MDPLRKLVILAANELLTRGLIKLDGPETADRDDAGYVMCELGGEPAVALWSNIGFEELRISAWWKYDHARHPQAELKGYHKEEFDGSRPFAIPSKYQHFLGACASGWLERREGKYLQGKARSCIFDAYVRRGELRALKAIVTPEPLGFAPTGKFHM
jgi:hypothetical protein